MKAYTNVVDVVAKIEQGRTACVCVCVLVRVKGRGRIRAGVWPGISRVYERFEDNSTARLGHYIEARALVLTGKVTNGNVR